MGLDNYERRAVIKEDIVFKIYFKHTIVTLIFQIIDYCIWNVLQRDRVGKTMKKRVCREMCSSLVWILIKHIYYTETILTGQSCLRRWIQILLLIQLVIMMHGVSLKAMDLIVLSCWCPWCMINTVLSCLQFLLRSWSRRHLTPWPGKGRPWPWPVTCPGSLRPPSSGTGGPSMTCSANTKKVRRLLLLLLFRFCIYLVFNYGCMHNCRRYMYYTIFQHGWFIPIVNAMKNLFTTLDSISLSFVSEEI